MKRILYPIVFVFSVTYAYLRGYNDGMKKTQLIEKVEQNPHIGTEDGSDESNNNSESNEFECDDDNCSKKFDSEHGKNVHMGVKH